MAFELAPEVEDKLKALIAMLGAAMCGACCELWCEEESTVCSIAVHH
jgi:hypothetical protein